MDSIYKKEVVLVQEIIEKAENNDLLKKQIIEAGYTEEQANKVSILISGMILAKYEF
ncbi:hypothetical protein IBB56_09290 [Listeria welshimeri]|uniref:hypothetical protein n=1 Tax=Listeria welshimeri TaxID=1643 RepID=UPI001626C12C|nr:hypothetical protein [Listeria welshimeri]EFP0884197.1 hypothetical protein [Listeria monocytogenes]EGC3653024.1 hypothetical protein [Listeria monocytogenes]MBC1663161.1 hypothetical protein [Listeria welshimeri]MBC1979800.1 hypothetical protein [Listeria welshimeri]MBC2089570.1 hypothetical protein [Listeria welshimeri]